MLGAALALHWAGFQSEGIVEGSWAAAMRDHYYGGLVPPGTLIRRLKRYGVNGISVGMTGAIFWYAFAWMLFLLGPYWCHG